MQARRHGARRGCACARAAACLRSGSAVVQPASVSVARSSVESLPLVHAESHLGVPFVCQYRLSVSYLNPMSVLTG